MKSSKTGQKGGQDGYSAVNKGKVEGDGVQKEGRMISVTAWPRAGPEGKDLPACYISLGDYL